MTELLLNDQIYHRVIEELVPDTQHYLWIVTADLKDLHVKKGKRYIPFLEILLSLIHI